MKTSRSFKTFIFSEKKSPPPFFYFSQKQPYLTSWKRLNVFSVCIIRQLTHSSHLSQKNRKQLWKLHCYCSRKLCSVDRISTFVDSSGVRRTPVSGPSSRRGWMCARPPHWFEGLCTVFSEWRLHWWWLDDYSEKIRSLKMLGFSEEKTPGGYSPLKMTTPLRWSNIFNLKEWTWSATKLKKNHTCFYPAGRIHHMSIILLLSTKQPLLQGLQYSTTKGFPSFTDSTPCVSIFLI